MMKNRLRTVAAFAFFAMIAAISLPEVHAGLTFDLDVVFDGNLPPDSSKPWLVADFVDNGNVVDVTITNYMEAVNDKGEYVEFTTAFGFNLRDDWLPSELSIEQTGSPNPHTTISNPSAKNSFDLPTTKGFDILFTWDSSNADKGVSRFNYPDIVTFTISRLDGQNLDAEDFNVLSSPSNNKNAAYAAAKVQGIPDGGSSTEIGDTSLPPPTPTPAVAPEPSTLLMGGLALVGLALARFRTWKKS